MARRRQIGKEVSARGHKEPGLRDGSGDWWFIGHRFLSKRPPLAVREQRAIDGLSSNEYHGAQPATLLCSAMWVSLSPGVSAPDWGVFFVDVAVYSIISAAFWLLAAIHCGTPPPPITWDPKQLFSRCAGELAGFKQVWSADLSKKQPLVGVLQQRLISPQRAWQLVALRPRYQPGQLLLVLHDHQNAPTPEPCILHGMPSPAKSGLSSALHI